MRARENPLRSERVQTVAYRPFGWTWDALDERLFALHYRCAIVGPEGSGKTTLLEELARSFASRGIPIRLITLTRDRRTLSVSRFDAHEIVLLDGAEQLRDREWARLARSTESARGLIITSHRAGPLPTLVTCEATRESLDYVLRELLTDAQLTPLGDAPERLLERHEGNIRLVLWELYDRLGSSGRAQGEPGATEAADDSKVGATPPRTAACEL